MLTSKQCSVQCCSWSPRNDEVDAALNQWTHGKQGRDGKRTRSQRL